MPTEHHTPTEPMDRLRAEATGETVTARDLHQNFAVGLWTPVRDEMPPSAERGRAPDKWVVRDADGEVRTFRRVEAAEADGDG